ncbi:MAG: transketolase C-terminal domain-containing protein [Candidatus Omnitrophota bacterium]|jgi:transketolase
MLTNGLEKKTMSGVDARDAFFEELYRLAEEDRNVIFMTADMGAFSLERFKRDLPRQYFNVGVAEQNMVSVAAGLAMAGKKVFIYSIVPFVTLRCLEQIKIDLCGMNLPVTVVGIGAGVMYGGDGPTHHALHDIAVMRALPGMTIYNPSDALLTQASVRLAYEHPGPVYIRIEKGCLPVLYEEAGGGFQQGFAQLRAGTDLSIMATGLMVHQAIAAKDILSRVGISVGIFDIYRLKPFNEQALLEVMIHSPRVVSLEENSRIGGLGTALIELCADAGCRVPFMRMAWPDRHCHEACSREDIHRHYQMDARSIAEKILAWVRSS